MDFQTITIGDLAGKTTEEIEAIVQQAEERLRMRDRIRERAEQVATELIRRNETETQP